MLFAFPKPQSINELEERIRVHRDTRPPIDVRQSIKIAVIDDQPFAASENLRNHGFEIQHFNDLSTLTTIKDYPIVLSDLQGVGRQLNQSLQGAYLIQEIKKNFPEKVVIAYTAGASTSNMSRIATLHADGFIKKDAPIDEWRDRLDQAIRNVTNPVYMWKGLRLRLIEAGITPFQLTHVEDAFVKSYASGEASVRDQIGTALQKADVGGAARTILTDFTASVIFRLIFGA